MKTTITNVVRSLLVASVLTVGFGLLPMNMAHAAVTDPYGKAKVSDSNFTQEGQLVVDPYKTVVTIINFVLGFLGIIAVIIILIAGFKWMTAAGNEDKVKEAQTMLIQGVIGLVIILSAWGIAQYAFTLPSEIVR